MMISKCFVPECTNKPYGKCDCTENYTIFCFIHAAQHFESLIGDKRHQCLRLYYTPTKETKLLFKKKISELRQSLKQYRKDIILGTKEIIRVINKNAEKALERFNEVEEKLSKLNYIAEWDEISNLYSEKDPENVLKMEPADAEFEMSEWYFPEFISKSELIVSNINSYFDIDLNPFQPPIRFDWNTTRDNEYLFFKGSGKELFQINLDNFQETKFTLNLAEGIHFQVSSCILPNKSVFYCSSPTFASGYTFIIDKNKNVKRLADSKYSPYMYPVYFDGFIYTLGGANNLAEKYCLETNTWQSCAPLPAGLNFLQTAAVLFKTEILLTGMHLIKLIKYSTKDNNYSEVAGLNLTENLRKTMFTGNKKVYILQHSESIFESRENDISVWNLVGINNIDPGAYPSTYVVQYNGCIYMIFLRYQLWEFNLSTKQLRLVQTYN